MSKIKYECLNCGYIESTDRVLAYKNTGHALRHIACSECGRQTLYETSKDLPV